MNTTFLHPSAWLVGLVIFAFLLFLTTCARSSAYDPEQQIPQSGEESW